MVNTLTIALQVAQLMQGWEKHAYRSDKRTSAIAIDGVLTKRKQRNGAIL